MRWIRTAAIAGLAVTVLTGCKRNVVVKSSLAPESAARADLAPLRSLLRQTASAQEIHYANTENRYTYATEVSRLRVTPPAGVVLTILESTQKGWSGMTRYGSAGPACVYYVGEVKPPVTPGGVVADRAGTVVCDLPRS